MKMRIKIASGDSEKIRQVGELVRSGGIIVYPTDTIYGIGGNPLDPAAVRRVLDIKRRENKPMPVLVSSVEKAEEFVEVNSTARVLMSAFWPGGLTIVLNARHGIPEQLTMGRKKLGVRMPNHALALKIIEASGGGLIGTSANISGQSAATSVDELNSSMEEAVDLIIDGGRTELGAPSTVVEIGQPEGGSEPGIEVAAGVRIIRVGVIGADLIRSKLVGKAVGGSNAKL
jgi:L-threonylcarbamoyladenylate synthase